MIDNFNMFGIEHIISIIIPIIILIIFVFITRKYPEKKKLIGIILALIIISIRSVRYGFDMNIGVFELKDLISVHICHIDLIILIICLVHPNKKLFLFTYLIGIPTALAVVLFPGQIHPEPGITRAMFFIMSHMMLVVGSVYLMVIYRFSLIKKDLYNCYLISLFGMVIITVFDIITKSNFMYLIKPPDKTLLESIYNLVGPSLYIISLYVILITILTLLYYIYKKVIKNNYI